MNRLTEEQKREMWKVTRRYMTVSFDEHWFETLQDCKDWIRDMINDANHFYQCASGIPGAELEMHEITTMNGDRVTEIYCTQIGKVKKQVMVMFFRTQEPGRAIG